LVVPQISLQQRLEKTAWPKVIFCALFKVGNAIGENALDRYVAEREAYE